jgi:hypothetical protein
MTWYAVTCPLDIAFVLDNSGSISDDVPADEDSPINNIQLIRNFTSSLVERLNFDKDQVTTLFRYTYFNLADNTKFRLKFKFLEIALNILNCHFLVFCLPFSL